MRKALLGGLCVVLAWAAGLARAGEAAGAADAEALKKELAALKEKVDALGTKRDALRDEVRKSPQLVELRAALDKAQAAYDEAKKADAAYPAAIKADDEASSAFSKLVREKLEANADAKTLLDEIEANKQDTPEAKQARAEARKKLDEIRHTIEKSDDADVKAALEKREATRKARAEARNAEPLVAARKVRDEARKAYDTKRHELEAANPDIAALTKERDELRTQMREIEKKLQ